MRMHTTGEHIAVLTRMIDEQMKGNGKQSGLRWTEKESKADHGWRGMNDEIGQRAVVERRQKTNPS